MDESNNNIKIYNIDETGTIIGEPHEIIRVYKDPRERVPRKLVNMMADMGFRCSSLGNYVIFTKTFYNIPIDIYSGKDDIYNNFIESIKPNESATAINNKWVAYNVLKEMISDNISNFFDEFYNGKETDLNFYLTQKDMTYLNVVKIDQMKNYNAHDKELLKIYKMFVLHPSIIIRLTKDMNGCVFRYRLVEEKDENGIGWIDRIETMLGQEIYKKLPKYQKVYVEGSGNLIACTSDIFHSCLGSCSDVVHTLKSGSLTITHNGITFGDLTLLKELCEQHQKPIDDLKKALKGR